MVMITLHVNSSCSSTNLILGSNQLATQQKQSEYWHELLEEEFNH